MPKQPGFDIKEMAHNMYLSRVQQEYDNGRHAMLERNPDAELLYRKGVHDALVAIRTWSRNDISPDLLETFMSELYKQTKDGPPAH